VVSVGVRARIAALLLILPACSGADGDLHAVDAAGESDATSPPPPDGSGNTRGDATSSSDAVERDDASGAEDSSAGDPDGDVGDALADVEVSDAGDAAPSLCSRICRAGCCDLQGKCRTTTTTAMCGAAGSMCLDCSMHVCAITSAGCCTAKGTCGCSVGGLLGCN
jgi:hypothetical protein